MAFSSYCKSIYSFVCRAQRESLNECLIGSLVFSYCKRKKVTIRLMSKKHTFSIYHISHVTQFYLSLEGLEVMTHSIYSLAAKESSTLFTSLVKLPSTCLLLNASPCLSISDLSVYTDAQCKHCPVRVSYPTLWKPAIPTPVFNVLFKKKIKIFIIFLKCDHFMIGSLSTCMFCVKRNHVTQSSHSSVRSDISGDLF